MAWLCFITVEKLINHYVAIGKLELGFRYDLVVGFPVLLIVTGILIANTKINI